MPDKSPLYTVVYCRRFGNGTPGWRLSEVCYYCFADSYGKAKSIVEDWNSYGGYDRGLSFMVKYENWLHKGGSEYDGLPFEEKRYR